MYHIGSDGGAPKGNFSAGLQTLVPTAEAHTDPYIWKGLDVWRLRPGLLVAFNSTGFGSPWDRGRV